MKDLLITFLYNGNHNWLMATYQSWRRSCERRRDFATRRAHPASNSSLDRHHRCHKTYLESPASLPTPAVPSLVSPPSAHCLSIVFESESSIRFHLHFISSKNKPRTAKVGAISKVQKVQNFQNMLMTFFYEKLTKKIHPKEAFRAGKTLQKIGYSGWDKCDLFSNLRLLLSKTEYTSEITSKIRI